MLFTSKDYQSKLILFIVTLILVFTIKMVVLDENTALDITFSNYLQRFSSDWLFSLMNFVTVLGNHPVIIAGYILLLLLTLFVLHHKTKAWKIPLIGLSALGWMYLLKFIFGRERPLLPLIEVSGYSFPSGHALNSLVFYGLVICMIQIYVNSKWVKTAFTIVLALLITAIGISRVYLGVHYLTDIIAGFCIGIIWLYTVLRITKFDECYSKSFSKNSCNSPK